MPRLSLLGLALVSLVLAGCGTLQEPMPSVAEDTTRRPSRPTPTSAEPTFDMEAFIAVADDDPRARGDVDAPVTIIEYSDFE